MTPTQTPDRARLRAYAMLACAMLFWAGNAIAGRLVASDIPPATLSLMRWTGASLLLMPFAWPHLIRDRAILIAGWRRVVAIGLLGIASFNALYYLGLHYTTASNGLLLQALIPGVVLLCDRLAFGTRPGWAAVAGVAVSTIGVAIIVFRGDIALLARFALNRGDAIILVSVVVWAIYTSLLQRRPAAHPLAFLFASFLVGTTALVPLAAAELLSGATIRWTPAAIGAVAYVTIFPSLLSYLLFNHGVATVGANAAGQAINLMPLFGALLAAGLLGEALHPYHAAGMALILAGLVTGLAGARRAKS